MRPRRFHFTRDTLAQSHPETAEDVRIVEEPCDWCWGQGRIFVRHPDGGGHAPMRCPRCLGVRTRFRVIPS